MAEYSRIAKGSFTSTGGAQMVNLPFQPTLVKMINYTTSAAAPADDNITSAQWDASMGQGFAVIQGYGTGNAYMADVVTSNGISTFSAGNALALGAAQNVSTITKASPAVVTSSSAHNLASGDVVIFQNIIETATTGMQQITSIPFTVTVTGTTTFTIPWNTNQSNFTAYNSGTATTQATFKKVLYPFLYAPGANIITAITTGTTTTIDTTSAHNFVVGQEVAFRIPTAYGTTELNSLPNSTVPGSPIYAYVTSVTDYNTFVVDVDSSSGYTAFDSNQTFASASGLNFAQVVAVGDVNSGGVAISAGSNLYPPPFVRPIGTTTVDTINGPAIQGSFFNNTSQGFIIGNGTGATNIDNAVLVGAVSDVIYWEAMIPDYANP